MATNKLLVYLRRKGVGIRVSKVVVDLDTLLSLLRIPSLGRIGSTKLVLPKWQKIGILNRDRRVICRWSFDGKFRFCF